MFCFGFFSPNVLLFTYAFVWKKSKRILYFLFYKEVLPRTPAKGLLETVEMSFLLSFICIKFIRIISPQ